MNSINRREQLTNAMCFGVGAAPHFFAIVCVCVFAQYFSRFYKVNDYNCIMVHRTHKYVQN